MQVKLTQKEKYHLVGKAGMPDRILILLSEGITTGKGTYVLDIAEEITDQVRDLVGEQLQKIGYDQNYNLNEDGKLLEALVDKFFIG